jgi:two-component system CheB/CheR fusion protein
MSGTKRDSEELEAEAVARLAAIVEASEDSITSKTLDGIVTSWNEGASRIFGYAADEMIGRPITQIIPRELHAEEFDILARIGRGEHVGRYETVRIANDGRRIDVIVQVSPIRDKTGAVVGASTIARDITERKAADDALRASEARLRDALDASGAGVWAWDGETGLITVDDAYRAMFGIAPDVAVDMDIWQALLHPDDREPLKQRAEECLRAGHQWREEFRVLHPQHGTRWLAGLGRVVRDGEGRVKGMTGINIDITERKQAEETQRLLIDELNHRVKNTLVTVQAMAEQTLQNARDPAHFVESFRGRLQALSRAHNLLTQRTWTGVDLESLIREQLQLIGGQTLTCEGPKIELRPREAVHLGLALHELGTNARKYGALRVPEGHLSVTWSLKAAGADHELELKWVERGGPAVSEPSAQGFGTLLIQRGLKHSLGGEARMTFAPDGMICELRVPHCLNQEAATA